MKKYIITFLISLIFMMALAFINKHLLNSFIPDMLIGWWSCSVWFFSVDCFENK